MRNLTAKNDNKYGINRWYAPSNPYNTVKFLNALLKGWKWRGMEDSFL